MASPALFKRSMRTADFNAIPARMRTLLLKKVFACKSATARTALPSTRRRRRRVSSLGSTPIQHSLVMPGLDPGIHAGPLQQAEALMEWIAGSSPAMTERLQWLAAEQLLLLIDIFLRNVAGRDERVDAGFGHVTGVLLEADVEKLAAKPILLQNLSYSQAQAPCTALVTVTEPLIL
jgi:hypothetical protein